MLTGELTHKSFYFLLFTSRLGKMVTVPLIVNLQITDTNTHSYQTNPLNPLQPTSGINLVRIYNERLGTPKGFIVYIYNYANQPVTIQPVGNENAKNFQYGALLDGNDYYTETAYPDFNIGSAISIPAAPSPGVIPSVQVISYNFQAAPIKYYSLYVTYQTAPTQGYIKADLEIIY